MHKYTVVVSDRTHIGFNITQRCILRTYIIYVFHIILRKNIGSSPTKY